MGVIQWGLLGPESMAGQRRTRTLNLGATVRSLNDLAVPGLGGVWFGKQIFLANLGVLVAHRARESGMRVNNIETANAVEALGCWLALNRRGWQGDPRVHGATKMFGKKDLAFALVRKRSFYVTQPMRQATIQPLRAFKLVDSSGERFNGFTCSAIGEEFIDAVSCVYRPYRTSVVDHLLGWVRGKHDRVTSSEELTNALSPIEPMLSSGCEFLRERAIGGATGDAKRRKNSLGWVTNLSAQTHPRVVWDGKPTEIDEDHWRDLHVGAMFFLVRDAAIRLLDVIEAQIHNQSDARLSLCKPLPGVVGEACNELRLLAAQFMDKGFDPTPRQDAATFCRECSDMSDVRIIERLLAREGKVLKQRSSDVVPGIAFRGAGVAEADTARSDEEVEDETQTAQTILLPSGISNRVRNLFLFSYDLHGELEDQLYPDAHDGAESL